MDTAQQVKELLDKAKARYGVDSDAGLAYKLGLSVSTISRLKKGHINKTAKIILDLATLPFRKAA